MGCGGCFRDIPNNETIENEYICEECKYVLKNGGTAAKEICPGCGALNSFKIFEWHH